MNRPIRRALISVSDKHGLIDFARFLQGQGVEILSTGGSAAAMRGAGIPVKDVSDFTGFPEMMDGRVKTLHPRVHGGILHIRDNAAHVKDLESHDMQPIDLVVVNLYPFEATVAKGADFATCIENIDIGGPSMVRSAAKNHQDVTIVVDVADYERVAEAMETHGGATLPELRRELAAKAFARTAAYDAAISRWFAGELGQDFPASLNVPLTLRQNLRYGENPHQAAAFYATGEAVPGVATATQLQGKELSYNNINDTDAAFELAAEFDAPAVAIIKHANPCGVAIGANLIEAYGKALACDPVSAFGGIIAVNREVEADFIDALGKLFLEVIIAPSFSAEAKAKLAEKKNLRLLETGGMPERGRRQPMLKSVAGGVLVQDRDHTLPSSADLTTVTEAQPTEAQKADLLFAFTVCKHVKSNAIVYVRDGATIGIGAGQMSRVDSTRVGIEKAKAANLDVKGSVMASDAFFPFADNVEAAAAAGVAAIIQPGGSIRDEEVIASANSHGIPMVFTGERHFRH